MDTGLAAPLRLPHLHGACPQPQPVSGVDGPGIRCGRDAEGIDSARFRKAFVAAFITVNMGYIWFVKDPQFEERAAHTTQLVEELQRRPPAPLLIENFPQEPGTRS